jgi:hypothetical protein
LSSTVEKPRPTGWRRVRSWIGVLAENHQVVNLQVIYVCFMIAIGPVLLGFAVVDDDPVTDADWPLAVVYLVFGPGLAAVFWLTSKETSSDPRTRHLLTAVPLSFLGLSAVSFLLLGAGQIVGVMANQGVTVSSSPPASQVGLDEIHGKLLYEAVDVVPLLDFSDTLGWEDPISDPGTPFGWILVSIKILLILVIVSGFTSLYRALPTMRRSRLSDTGEVS